MTEREGLAELLAPCGKCRLIKGRETGYIIGPDISVFRNFNGSSRFVWLVSGRPVAAIWVEANSGWGSVVGAFTHPDYTGAGLGSKLYQVAEWHYDKLSLSPNLPASEHSDELIAGLIQLMRKRG